MNISRLPGERAEETVQGIAAAQLNRSALDLVTYRDSSFRSGTLIWMSMTGLASNPGTAVDPTCSIRSAVAPSCSSRRSRHRS